MQVSLRKEKSAPVRMHFKYFWSVNVLLFIKEFLLRQSKFLIIIAYEL